MKNIIVCSGIIAMILFVAFGFVDVITSTTGIPNTVVLLEMIGGVILCHVVVSLNFKATMRVVDFRFCRHF